MLYTQCVLYKSEMKKNANYHKQNSDTINYQELGYARGLVTLPNHINITKGKHSDVNCDNSVGGREMLVGMRVLLMT